MDGVIIDTRKRVKCSQCKAWLLTWQIKPHKARYHKPKPATARNPKIASMAKKVLANETSCAYCGEYGTDTRGPDNLFWQMDHVIPLSLQGPDTFENIVKVCHSCNLRKGSKRISPPGRTMTAAGVQLERTQIWEELTVKKFRKLTTWWEGEYIA
jgi:5-methylcytosine-specific restriction endonuclease McrA